MDGKTYEDGVRDGKIAALVEEQEQLRDMLGEFANRVERNLNALQDNLDAVIRDQIAPFREVARSAASIDLVIKIGIGIAIALTGSFIASFFT